MFNFDMFSPDKTSKGNPLEPQSMWLKRQMGNEDFRRRAFNFWLRLAEEEAWFRDKTFLGLYNEKEREYQSGKVTPFLDMELMQKLSDQLGAKNLWEITENDIEMAEGTMLAYAKQKHAATA